MHSGSIGFFAMHPAALLKASAKFERAKIAVERLRAATTQAEIESAWKDFIAAASTIYATLEQGSKGPGKSQPWYGHKRQERRADPLLRYVHHARNAEEHGLARITERGSSSVELSGRGSFIEVQDVAPGTWQIANQGGNVRYSNDQVRLVRVVDSRYNDTFDPPTKHLGQPIENGRIPLAVAEMALAYLDQMIAEAHALPPPP